MKKMDAANYNERLFESGFRRRFHLSRFQWARDALIRVGAPCEHVFELGCFDGRAIEFLPHRPERYLGLDANWEGGLNLGKQQYLRVPGYRFEFCNTPDLMRDIVGTQTFDTAICLETLEHVSPNLVDGYIAAISDITTRFFVITVPNETGLMFLAKYLVKRVFGDFHPYRFSEILGASLGRMEYVERNDHKGFDYRAIVATVARSFRIFEVSAYPFRRLPKCFGFGIGIVAERK